MDRLLTFAALAVALAGCGGSPTPVADDKDQRAAQPAAFRIERVSLPGPGPGESVLADSVGRRLFLTRATEIHVLNLDSFAAIATVDGLKQARGVALASGKAFASDGAGDSIVVFDPADGAISKTLRGGQNPGSILHDPVSGMIFVFNGASQDVSILDPAAEAIVKTIPVNDTPGMAGSDGKGRVYFTMARDHAIGVIDTATGRLSKKYVLPGCVRPVALAIDAANARLFSSCANGSLKIVDALTGRVVAGLPVGRDPAGIIYDPTAKRLVVAARAGHWTIIKQVDPDHYRVEQVLRVDRQARTLAFDPQTGRILSPSEGPIPPPAGSGKAMAALGPAAVRLMVVSEAR